MSDGVSQVVTLINNQVYSKLEDTLENYCVIQFTSYLKPQVQGKNVLILAKAPKLIYKDIKTKIGCPRDYELNVKDDFACM